MPAGMMAFEIPRLKPFVGKAPPYQQRFYAVLIRTPNGREFHTPWCSSRIWIGADIFSARAIGHTPIAVVVAWLK